MLEKKSKAPLLLTNLIKAHSPSGYEQESQNEIDEYIGKGSDLYTKDSIGNRYASINLQGYPSLMFSGHMDEIGLIISYINEQGFIYFQTIGGHDISIVSGRSVKILTKNGLIQGITGKRAIHLMTIEERKNIPRCHEIWIDIGSKTKEETSSLVSIGDSIVYDYPDIKYLNNNLISGRAFDNKTGCYVVCEVIKRLSEKKDSLKAKITSVATTQEEIGIRGAIISSYNVNPDIAIAVDVGHATDSPDCDKRQFGDISLGKGPIISRGANINPIVFNRLITIAKEKKIPYQIEAEGGVTGTDARAIQVSRKGVATGLVSIPLRYMHTPNEVASLEDIENTVKLLIDFSMSINAKDTFNW